MRGTKAKRLRREAKESGVQETKTTNIKKTPGPNRAERRMEKYQPDKYAQLQHDNDPAVARMNARRWIYAFSPKLRQLAQKATPDRKKEVA